MELLSVQKTEQETLVSDILRSAVEGRAAYLSEQRKQGKKVLGISGVGYTPEELIRASGAISQRMIRGGDYEPVEEAAKYISRFLSTFTRAQFGYYSTKKEPIYQQFDAVVGEVTSVNMGRLMDLFEYYTDLPVLPLGVPLNQETEGARKFYSARLAQLKASLEKMTSKQVTDESLEQQIALSNKTRTLLAELGALRTGKDNRLKGSEFIKLNHLTFFQEPKAANETLEGVLDKFRNRTPVYDANAPRILLLGCPMAAGDYGLPAVIEQAGGAIVGEELGGGLRHYDTLVKGGGSPMENLIERYLRGILPTPYNRPWGRRIPYFEKLATGLKVDGVIWYQLLYEEAFTLESYWVEKKMAEHQIPFLVVESEYDLDRKSEQVSTRVETFMSTMRRR